MNSNKHPALFYSDEEMSEFLVEPGNFSHKYTKIKINSDDNLPL